jgi:3-hydroxybutyryl-CoA dehydrogenase
MLREFRKVGVVGLGTMGAGIAEVFARGGLRVVGVEADEAALARGRAHLDRSVRKAVDRGKLSPSEGEGVLGAVRLSTSYADLADADLVIEAVPERMDLKHAVFAELDRICKPDAVLATNTSSLSVTEIAAGTSRTPHIVGFHFFNPAPVMKLVEVIHTVVTEPRIVEDVAELVRGLGKTPVSVTDRAGFVANALLLPYLNHAVRLYEAKYATREDIDTAMKLGVGLPMGPLALLDMIGLDTSLSVMDALYDEFREHRYVPAPLLRRMVAAGLLGRKTGRGFYAYGDEPAPEPATVEPVEPDLVGVLGEEADEFAELCRAAGYSVTLAEFGVEEKVLNGCDLVVVATPAARAVIDLALRTGRAADAVGLRLVPGGDGALAEIVTTVETSDAAVARAIAVCRAIGRTPVRCPDRAGFLMDALLLPHINDAVRMLESGYALASDIDNAMRLGCGYPHGPLELADGIGLDRVQSGLRRLLHQYRDPEFAPVPLLEHMVAAGRGGRGGRGLRTTHD